MAILSADKTYVTVEKGDNLWAIAKKYLGSGSKYKQLVALNNLQNDGKLIYPSQKIKLTGTASSSSSNGTVKVEESNKAKITQFGLMASSSSNTLFAVWTWGKASETEKYEYEWEYTVKDTAAYDKSAKSVTWWTGSKSSTPDQEVTYNIPDNAEAIRFRVRPIAKTKKSGSKEVALWTAEWTNFVSDGAYSQYFTDKIPPDPPGNITVKVDDLDPYKLTATLSGLYDDDKFDATHIQFQVVKDYAAPVEESSRLKINEYGYVSFTTTKKLVPGATYSVRCKSIRNGLVGEWSKLSGEVVTPPPKPSGFTVCRAQSRTVDDKITVYLEWDQVSAATSYDIDYETNIEDFNLTDRTIDKTDLEDTKYETDALASGARYYFRIRAKNSAGTSDWSDISEDASLVLGEKPAVPTTWSSASTTTVNAPLNLYWIHNSNDGSSQTWAILELELYETTGERDTNGNLIYECKWTDSLNIENSTDPDKKDKTSVFDVTAHLKENASEYYNDGVQLRWRVQTRGISDHLSDFSTMRTIDIYAQPSVDLKMVDGNDNAVGLMESLTAFPIKLTATTAPKTQAPVGFHLTIIANDPYETIDSVGNNKTVSVGEAVYSKYFDQNTDLDAIELTPGDVDLMSGINYTINCVAAMDSGLTASTSSSFTVNWDEVAYVPNASITYDPELYVTSIHPYCNDVTSQYFIATYDEQTEQYTKTTTTADPVGIEPVTRMFMANGTQAYSGYNNNGDFEYFYLTRSGTRRVIDKSDIVRTEYAYTTTGEQVYSAMTEFEIDTDGNIIGGEDIVICDVRTETPVENVTLAVYRREFDGSFTELATGLDNTVNTFITDPHPALDYARYRIVATSGDTGAVSYYDVPAYPIQEKAIIIQWAEEWSTFDMDSDDPLSQPPWSGSLLRLPYNIDVSDNFGVDVSLIEYAGRKRPVAYYGTQLGETSSWNTVIPKDDEETLYGLRRLAIWTGDVYVREPSGTGYWANVSVSFSQKHLDKTIPVTISITRVEGGA